MKLSAPVKILLFFVSLFFCLTSYAADSGLFMVVKGDIKVQKSDSQMQVAKVGLKVAVGDTIISAADSRAKIVMLDHNVINISPSTKMKIEKYTTGADKNVELSLIEGKVRSNVEQEYDGEKTKYLIKTPTAVAGVRGTQFITSFDAKTKITEIVTLKGQVSFTSLVAANTSAANSTVLVKKGEASSMNEGQVPDKPKPVAADVLKAIDRDTSGGRDAKGAKGDDSDSSGNDKKGDKKGDKKDDRKDPPPLIDKGDFHPDQVPTPPPPPPKVPTVGCPPICPPPPINNGPAKVKVTPTGS